MDIHSEKSKTAFSLGESIKFENINFSIKTKKKEKQILSNINLVIQPGKILAILGSSGAGKTSLLNILAGKIPKFGNATGKMITEDEKISVNMKDISAYVIQEDVLYGQQTVYETLDFYAKLRYGNKLSHKDREDKIMNIINELSLIDCKDTKIGNEFTRGISGGEKKRVSIGIELIKDVNILFLDEPTTGLDSYTSLNVMKHLHNLVTKTNCAVVLTIHQPGSIIYGLFDNILLLSNGYTMYFGNADLCIPYFENLGYKCPIGYNYSDYLLDLVSPNFKSEESKEKSLKMIKELKNKFEESKIDLEKGEEVEDNIQFKIAKQDLRDTGILRKIGIIFSQYCIICKREFNEYFRNIKVLIAMAIQNIFFSLLIGGIFFNLGYKFTNIQDRSGVLFFIILNISIGPLFEVIHTFAAIKAIYNKEYSAGLYSSIAYYLSLLTVRIISQPLFVLLYISICYKMINLNPSWSAFFILFATSTCSRLCGVFLGFAISAASSNLVFSNIMAPAIFIPCILLSGLYINLENISKVFYYLQYISFTRYSFVIAMLNEFRGTNFNCENTELPPGCCVVSTGEMILSKFSMQDESILVCFFGMFAFAMFCIVLGAILLKVNSPTYKQLQSC